MAPQAGAERIADALGTLLLRANRSALHERLTSVAEGVDATTYPVLSGLARIGPATSSRLAAAAGLERSVTSRYADRLRQRGLLRRLADPGDGRAAVLALTPAGEEAVAAMRAELVAAITDALAGWDAASVAGFADGLAELVEALTSAAAPPAGR